MVTSQIDGLSHGNKLFAEPLSKSELDGEVSCV